MNEIFKSVWYRCATMISSGGTEKLHQYRGAKIATVMLRLEYAFAKAEVIQFKALSIFDSPNAATKPAS